MRARTKAVKRNEWGFAVAAVAAMLLWGAPCAAQVAGIMPEPDVPGIAGIAVGVMPDYEGSNDYTIGVAPYFRYTFTGQERYVQLFANELSANLLNHPNFQFGPMVAYRFGRASVDDEVVKLMQDIDDTVEIGAFASYIYRSQNPRQRFIAIVDVLGDVGGVSDGVRGGVGARYWHPVASAMDVMIGARFNLASTNYMNTYFGVSAADSGQSGLPLFEASGGAKDVALQAAAVVYLSPSWLLGVGVRYARLLGDAADSPIVDGRGSADQLMAGMGIGYVWGGKQSGQRLAR